MKPEIILILVGLFLALLGILIKHFRLYNLIAGYNYMPIKEKATFSIEKFATLLRNVFLITGILIVIGAILGNSLKIDMLCPIITLIAVVVSVLYLNIKGSRMKKK